TRSDRDWSSDVCSSDLFIEEQIAKRAAAADAASTEKLAAAAFATEKAAVAGKPPDQRPKLDSGVIAALGVAAAGIGGMIGGVVRSEERRVGEEWGRGWG